MAKFNIGATEATTMASLKDFQKATVERIDYLFRHGQNRVLVADEVGMGKTLVARGAIVKTARLCLEEGNDLLKVVYICSNTSIANQNIQKLKVSDTARIERVEDTRLSMLHLKLAEQEADQELRDGFIQLIPLTPGTSFRMTTGEGKATERALMYAILIRLPELKIYKDQLYKMLIFSATGSWKENVIKYINAVEQWEVNTGGKYPSNIIEALYSYDREKPFLQELIERCIKNSKSRNDTALVNRLRIIFAQISAEMLNPDLVIMDEFQRFKYLIKPEEDTEADILARRFLDGGDTRTLLLSATPYKLYSTLEEIDASSGDDAYDEFLQVMDFLFRGKEAQFRQTWHNYSIALHELSSGNTAVLHVKNAAEAAMYNGVCRTERISVMDSGDYIDDSSVKTPITVNDKDILSYVEAGRLLKIIGANFSLPLDYVKSCPYLMSFMRGYKVKKKIEKYFEIHPDEVNKARNDLLWVNSTDVNKYRELPSSNARLEKLKETVFKNNSELYLWVPPSRPYYPLQGVYKDSADFSKVLVFSAWEMVPRMIGAMISYESERRTVGKLLSMSDKVDIKNARYYSKKRYPYPRLLFSLSGSEPQKMSLFTLLYPSKTLASFYNPIESLNSHQSLDDIEWEIKVKVKSKIERLTHFKTSNKPSDGKKWYYLAPMLMDGENYVNAWIYGIEAAMSEKNSEVKEALSSGRGNMAFALHIEKLKQYVSRAAPLELGPMPDDLVEILTDMALASPAVCSYRANGGNAVYATSLAKVFLNYFNSTESTAIVELAANRFHSKQADDSTHWQDVLLYCKDGCFQAMLDEYFHLIKESVSFTQADKKDSKIQNIMLENLRIHTASYDVDSFRNFSSRVTGKGDSSKKLNLMRAHFAVGFINDGDDTKQANRKDSIRAAFNSPLKPFVLASTSIGQEGLDFHNYCRKIMHWNLPSNPIDLEQREGRINRFKCLAIRQNVALNYGNIRFKNDIWEEMFAAAQAEKKEGQSELVPFWCFGENQKIKIERIVPMYPMSMDEINYERLIKILSLYRLTLGQARQEELLEYIFKECKDTEELKKLFIDLSPFSKGSKKE